MFMNEIIQVNNLHKTFEYRFGTQKHEALRGISFNVQKNEIFGYLGPNGAGKTTTLKILMGLIKPESGSFSIMGSSIEDENIRAKIGFLPENPSFYPFLSAYETLQMICDLYRMPKKMQDDRIRTFLSIVGIEKAMNKRVGGFSKGMLQRLGLAQAIINDPEIIILDEPLSGLDPLGRKEFKDIILLMKRRGKTVVFSSHILPDIEMIADKVCVINQGQLVGTGYVQDIVKKELKEIDIEIFINDVSKLDIFKDKCKFFAIRDSNVFITVEDENTAGDIIHAIAGANGKIISYLPREKSLEDYFLNLIEGANE